MPPARMARCVSLRAHRGIARGFEPAIGCGPLQLVRRVLEPSVAAAGQEINDLSEENDVAVGQKWVPEI